MNEKIEKKANILFVDDDENITNTFLRDFGKKYNVTTVSNGQRGLEVIRRSKPFQVIISDYKMPGINGIEFLEASRKISPLSIRIILTGYADLQICIDAVNKGNVFRFYTKPVEHFKLERGIKEATIQYRLNSLIKSDRLKNDFLAIISHEIRTPINSITNFLQLIKDEIGEAVFKKVEPEFNIIDKNVRRLIRTIELMVNISEIKSNTIKIKNSNIKLIHDVITPILNEYFPLAKKKGIEIDFHNKDEEFEINIDRYCIEQIFINLLDNAITFSDKGKVSIIIANSVNELTISISDNGIGMSKEFQQIMFEPFVQEQGGYSRKYEGNGLGLTLVKGYCLLNNINIEVESEKKKGTTVSLKLDKRSSSSAKQIDN